MLSAPLRTASVTLVGRVVAQGSLDAMLAPKVLAGGIEVCTHNISITQTDILVLPRHTTTHQRRSPPPPGHLRRGAQQHINAARCDTTLLENLKMGRKSRACLQQRAFQTQL